jgi:hypothetical protein
MTAYPWGRRGSRTRASALRFPLRGPLLQHASNLQEPIPHLRSGGSCGDEPVLPRALPRLLRAGLFRSLSHSCIHFCNVNLSSFDENGQAIFSDPVQRSATKAARNSSSLRGSTKGKQFALLWHLSFPCDDAAWSTDLAAPCRAAVTKSDSLEQAAPCAVAGARGDGVITDRGGFPPSSRTVPPFGSAHPVPHGGYAAMDRFIQFCRAGGRAKSWVPAPWWNGATPGPKWKLPLPTGNLRQAQTERSAGESSQDAFGNPLPPDRPCHHAGSQNRPSRLSTRSAAG